MHPNEGCWHSRFLEWKNFTLVSYDAPRHVPAWQPEEQRKEDRVNDVYEALRDTEKQLKHYEVHQADDEKRGPPTSSRSPFACMDQEHDIPQDMTRERPAKRDLHDAHG